MSAASILRGVESPVATLTIEYSVNFGKRTQLSVTPAIKFINKKLYLISKFVNDSKAVFQHIFIN